MLAAVGGFGALWREEGVPDPDTPDITFKYRFF